MKKFVFKVSKNSPRGGFTIVELMIATAVFAVVLLIAQVSFVQIGRLFYRGVSISQTQETADHIFQDIQGNFQNAPNVGGSQTHTPGVYDYYCIGNSRYTFRINNEISSDSTPNHSPGGNFGVLKDVLPGAGGACAAPCDPPSGTACTNSTVEFSNPVELLGNKMRVEQFDITQATTTSNLYNFAIVLAYGDTDTLTYTDPADFSTVSCQGDAQNTFCAVSRINTAVYRGIH